MASPPASCAATASRRRCSGRASPPFRGVRAPGWHDEAAAIEWGCSLGRVALRLRLGLVADDADFRRFWASRGVSALGDGVGSLALPLTAVLMLGASAWEMGVLRAAGTTPALVLSLVAGVWVDRLRRRPVMIVADLGRAALLLIVPLAAALGALRIELLW